MRSLEPRKTYRCNWHHDSHYNVAIFRKADAIAELRRHGLDLTAPYADIAACLTGWTGRDCAPGQWFRTEPNVRIGSRNILVRQFVAWDV